LLRKKLRSFNKWRKEKLLKIRSNLKKKKNFEKDKDHVFLQEKKHRKTLRWHQALVVVYNQDNQSFKLRENMSTNEELSMNFTDNRNTSLSNNREEIKTTE